MTSEEVFNSLVALTKFTLYLLFGFLTITVFAVLGFIVLSAIFVLLLTLL